MNNTENETKTEDLGRITMCEGGLYSVRFDNGDTVKCRARGNFRYRNMSPEVGDLARVKYLSTFGNNSDTPDAVLEEIGQRRNLLIRPPVANLDYMFVTVASASPEPDLSLVDKMICICEYNGIEPIVVVGKCELNPERAESITQIYSHAGFNSFALSCHKMIGVEEFSRFVRRVLFGKAAAFSGASGVGKSTLMNMLFPELHLETSDVSRKTERGRHTTRKVTLFPMYGGYIADTPGFSMLDFEHFDFFGKDELFGTYREFAPYAGKCRYTKCTHTKEDGCAVIEAVKRREIAESRHESYVSLYDILKTKKVWEKDKKDKK